MNENATIAAIATATGRGGVGIVRLSGSRALVIGQAICGGKNPPERTACYSDFFDHDGQRIDSGLILYFRAPASFTGEDVVELHGHGGTVVLQMLLERCLQLGARHAQAGEFSQRAFLNGKIDLVQAEAVADLIDASSQTAARMAMRSLKGAFSSQIHALVDGLIHVRMLVEANLDFPEEDIDFSQQTAVAQLLQDVRQQLDAVQMQAQQGAVLREGIHVVLAGVPNVGKSSLLNALAGDEVAIVTDIAGTTRDTVREQIVLDGVPFHIIDTAGLRETDDPIEQIGMERSRRALADADLVLVLHDAHQPSDESQLAQRLPEALPRIDVFNKIDLTGKAACCEEDENGSARVHLSAKTGEGLDLLRQLLLRKAGWLGDEGGGLFLARSRHVQALQRANAELAQAADCVAHDLAWELLAEHLRLAQLACSEITGEFTADDLLGVIFSQFCIGK